MNWLYVGLGAATLLIFGGIAYWQLVVAEGTYLGPRAVVLMYDWSARIYERIKRYDIGSEQWFLGLPLALALEHVDAPLVLDVATGTGRLPRAILRQAAFDGRLIGLDLSRRMLAEAVRRTAQFADRVTYIWQDARKLPFDNGVFDAVTCLEAIEFTPCPLQVVAELVRVLRPGGVLVVTNRIGPQAKLLPGRAFPPEEFVRAVERLGMEDVMLRQWQLDYDLIWAIKSGEPRGGGVHPLPQLLRCPHCGGRLARDGGAFRCAECRTEFPVALDGVIEMARR
jgi:SAM-dependent methyltransferase